VGGESRENGANGFGSFDPDEFLIEAAVEEGERVRVDPKEV
jgi:hypothetical protein